jgi:Signal transduction histidine kinase
MKSITILFFAFIITHSIHAQKPELYTQKADSLINRLNTQEHTQKERIQLYYDITETFAAHDMDSMHFYGRKGLELALKENDKRMIIFFYNYIGSYYVFKSEYDTALIYTQKHMKIAEELKDNSLLLNGYFSIGNIHARQGKYATAIENYLKVLKYWDGKGNNRTYVLALGNIGECHRRLNNMELAIYYLEQELVLAEEISDYSGRAQARRELGYIYLEQGDIDRAFEYQSQALEIVKDITPVQESDCREALIKIHILKKEYDKALEHSEHCLRLADKFGDPNMFVLAWISLSDIYLKQESYQECEVMATKAWNTDSTSVDTAPRAALNIAYANMFLGNKEKAMLFFEKHNEINKQKSQRSFHNALSDLEVKYETEKKELRIESLEKQKQYYIWLGSAGTILLLFAFFALFYRNRLIIQKRKVAEQQKTLAEKQMVLAEQQREIAEQNNKLAEQQIKQLEKDKQLIATQAVLDGETAERSRLAKELHNRLGSILTVIILNLKEITGYSILEKQDVNRFDKALELLDQSVVELRRIAHHLMPDSLIRSGLRTSIEDFCIAIPTANFKYYGSDIRLDNRLEIVLYQSAYELINNAVKYAEATAINVQLLIDNRLVSLTVKDNGKGFDQKKLISGTGLENIRTHVSVYNGKMDIYSSSDNGTEVCIEIEIKKMAEFVNL